MKLLLFINGYCVGMADSKAQVQAVYPGAQVDEAAFSICVTQKK